MTTQPKTTEAENPYLTREDALAILNTPDDQLDELIARAEKLRRKYKGDNVGIHILTNARSGNCSQDCAYLSLIHILNHLHPQLFHLSRFSRDHRKDGLLLKKYG